MDNVLFSDLYGQWQLIKETENIIINIDWDTGNIFLNEQKDQNERISEQPLMILKILCSNINYRLSGDDFTRLLKAWSDDKYTISPENLATSVSRLRGIFNRLRPELADTIIMHGYHSSGYGLLPDVQLKKVKAGEDGNAAASRLILEAKAASGDLKACYELAAGLYWGVFGERDYEKAYKLFRDVSLSSDVDSLYVASALRYMGHIAYIGKGNGKPDYKLAYERHKKAYKLDPQRGHHYVAMMAEGIGCDLNFDHALSIYSTELKFSDNNTIYEMGERCYQYGYYDNAAKFFDQVKRKNINAAYKLALIYKNGLLHNPRKPDYDKALEILSEAVTYFSDSACHADIFLEIGKLYFFHKDNKDRFEQAKAMFEKAAEHGSIDALYHIGYLYEYGYIGSHCDLLSAAESYECAAKQGHLRSIEKLALLFQLEGSQRDFAKAKKYAKLSEQYSLKDGVLAYGHLFFFGRGVKRDLRTAKAYYTKAYSLGSAEAKDLMELIE